MDKKVIRMRPYNNFDDNDTESITALREMAEDLLHNFTLRGFPEIPKISTSQALNECKLEYFNAQTGAVEKDDKGNWVIETDGTAL